MSNPARWEDVELGPEKIAQMVSYGGQRYLDHYIRGAKVRAYIEKVLVKDPKSTSKQTYRCCVEGTNYWRRQDGAEITPADLDAVRNHILGQENDVSLIETIGTTPGGKSGFFEIKQRWLCDSSD